MPNHSFPKQMKRLASVPARKPSRAACFPARRNRMPAKNSTPRGPTKMWFRRPVSSTRFQSVRVAIRAVPTAVAIPTNPASSETARSAHRLRTWALKRPNLWKKSETTTPEMELMPELKLDMAAASKAASSSPDTPAGSSSTMNMGITRSALAAISS